MYSSKHLLGVHATHLLLGKFGGKQILAALEKKITDDMLVDKRNNSFQANTYITQTNDAYTTEVKKILNYYLPYDAREKILNELVKELLGDAGKIISEFYLSENEIKEMHDAGMIIGSHTVSHPVMSRISAEEQEQQIIQSFNYLENITGPLLPKSFCYPYGGFHSFSETTEQLLQKNNCSFSFNVEPRDIDAKDLSDRQQALPRYDCNMFPHGQVYRLVQH